jgi:hypothetical protein
VAISVSGGVVQVVDDSSSAVVVDAYNKPCFVLIESSAYYVASTSSTLNTLKALHPSAEVVRLDEFLRRAVDGCGIMVNRLQHYR